MANFFDAFERSMNFEGRCLTNTPNDPGGQTYWGISRKYNPLFPGWALIDAGRDPADPVLEQMAQDWYHNVIWNHANLGDLEDQLFANMFFDTIINPGPICIKTVQILTKVKLDGICGPDTIEACNTLKNHELLYGLVGWRKLYYQNLVNENPDKAEWLAGWLKRCEIS